MSVRCDYDVGGRECALPEFHEGPCRPAVDSPPAEPPERCPRCNGEGCALCDGVGIIACATLAAWRLAVLRYPRLDMGIDSTRFVTPRDLATVRGLIRAARKRLGR